jgi:hypothetical protein
MFAPPPDPVNLQTVDLPGGGIGTFNPQTGQITPVMEGPGGDVGYIASGQAAADLGLDPAFAYNITSGPDGMKASQIGGGGTNITLPSDPMKIMSDGRIAIADPNVEGGVRFVTPPGSAAAVDAQAAGEAAKAAQATAQRAIDLAKSIRDDPALPAITGNIQGNLPAGIPLLTGGQAGTDLNARVNQLKGQVFLEAFEALKGGGTITELEGLKAERAMARLERAQSVEAYQEALDDFVSAIEQGMAKLSGGQSDGLTADERRYLGIE